MDNRELHRSGLRAPTAGSRKRSKKKCNAEPPDAAACLETVADGRVACRYRPKQIIFAQGDIADSVFYVRDGRVKVTVVSGDGREAVIAILGRDEFLGEGCLTGNVRRRMTATALTECNVTTRTIRHSRGCSFRTS